MNKFAVQQASTVWAANAPAPLTRDQQIALMITAQQRRKGKDQ
jgi:hypothetical protein